MSFLLFAILVCLIFVTYQQAEAQAIPPDPTYPVDLTLKFSDYPPTYTASMFQFAITGTSASGTVVNATVALTHYTDDTATANVNLPIGTYTISEVGPIGFVAGQWTVQWSGYGCVNANGPSLSTTINVTNDQSANVCRADNQWRPGKLLVEKIIQGTTTSPTNFNFTVTQDSTVVFSGPFESDGINDRIDLATGTYSVVEDSYPDYTTTYSTGCSGTIAQGGSMNCSITNTLIGTNPSESTTTGTLVVEKVVSGGPLTPDAFSFLINDTATTSFNSNGSNTLTQTATGTYTITEVPHPSYTTTYNNCISVLVVAGTTTTCTITNTYISNGGGSSPDTYRLQGYVWHDTNENGVWDNGETPLPDWTVYASSSDSLLTATTDANGLYSFNVSAGTWILSEVLQADWYLTHPTPITYEVTVPEEQEETFTLRFPFNLLFSIAHAETVIISTDFNFGNVFRGGTGGGSITTTSGSRSGGSGTRITPNPSIAPTPQVLGESISLIPVGAPATGAGGSTSKSLPVTVYVAALLILLRDVWVNILTNNKTK